MSGVRAQVYKNLKHPHFFYIKILPEYSYHNLLLKEGREIQTKSIFSLTGFRLSMCNTIVSTLQYDASFKNI